MKLHTLKPAAGSVKAGKRVGRGQGSGRGGTSTRGHKGAKSRSGYSRKLGFEGGQMPLQRRIPKFGFKNPFRVSYKAVNLYKLQELADAKGVTTITTEFLCDNGLASKKDLIKILGTTSEEAKSLPALSVSAHAFSNSAKSAIEAAGGSVTIL